MPIIEVDHVTKEFQLGELQSLKVTLRNQWRRLRGQPEEQRQVFKALHDVHFSVEPGEVLGIIGHNGAGKSTLLKLLAGISKPTAGRIEIRGNVAPLIEVGAGFVGQLTGRENVYLNAAILGISKKEVERKFDEIVDFAEIAEFIDTPVKRYSSGMRVKLAFAVATSIEAQILIVDEVLAVGDLAFQRKCFDRMEDLIKRQGRTVLLVSHNIRQVERLCSRVIMLDHGRITGDGDPHEVCDRFYAQNDEKVKVSSAAAMAARARLQSTGAVELVDISFVDDAGQATETIEHDAPATLKVRYRLNQKLTNPIFGIGVHTVDFLYLATNITEEHFANRELEPGVHELTFRMDKFPFLPGVYAVRLGVNSGGLTNAVFYQENALNFQVIKTGAHRTQSMQEGFVALNGAWQLESSTPPVHDPRPVELAEAR